MSKEARSKGACWTCKLRRKKCQEQKPACSACTSLNIPCFGYDPKPEWADGGVKQSAKEEELRITIRELASVRRRGRKKQGVAHVNGSRTVKPFDENVSDTRVTGTSSKAEKNDLDGDEPFKVLSEGQPYQDLIASASLERLRISESRQDENLSTVDALEYDSQANLLMHYLDVVFPSQFPFYDPASFGGGRGWLLFIILGTKPLYHAALSMAAYHQKLQTNGDFFLETYETGAVATLHTHRSLAIKELRYHLDSFRQEERAQSLVGNVEVLACIVFIISLEVFLADTQSWHIHLQAAQSLLPGLQKGCAGNSDKLLSPSYKRAHRFFVGVICWYDILSSSMTGMKAWARRVCLDTQLGFINLERIIGCENSVILAILQTTELKVWKAMTKEAGDSNVADLVNGAMEIERSLTEDLEHYDQLFEQATIFAPITRADQMTDTMSVGGVCRTSQTGAITRIFACAALVYLHVVVYGPLSDHPKIHESVSRTIAALSDVRNRAVLGMLAWPLCVAGCMASGWQMEFFRQLSLDSDKISDLKSASLKRSFAVVEECWRLRSDGIETDWQQAMHGKWILLI